MNNMKNPSILIVGDVMLDRYWFGDVNRISPEAPVPVVLIGKNEERLGGAANVARNVAALGASCSLLGVIGDDEEIGGVAHLLDDVKLLIQPLPVFLAVIGDLPGQAEIDLLP